MKLEPGEAMFTPVRRAAFANIDLRNKRSGTSLECPSGIADG